MNSGPFVILTTAQSEHVDRIACHYSAIIAISEDNGQETCHLVIRVGSKSRVHTVTETLSDIMKAIEAARRSDIAVFNEEFDK